MSRDHTNKDGLSDLVKYHPCNTRKNRFKSALSLGAVSLVGLLSGYLYNSSETVKQKTNQIPSTVSSQAINPTAPDIKIDSESQAMDLFEQYHYTNNKAIRTVLLQELKNKFQKSLADTNIEPQYKVIELFKFNIRKYYDFVLDNPKSSSEDWSRNLSQELTGILNGMFILDPSSRAIYERHKEEVSNGETENMFNAYFNNHGYRFEMLIHTDSNGKLRQNIVLARISELKEADVMVLENKHTFSYRDILEKEIDFIDAYANPDARIGGSVHNTTSSVTVDRSGLKKKAEHTWKIAQKNHDASKLLQYVFDTSDKDAFITEYMDILYREARIHEGTHHFRMETCAPEEFIGGSPKEELIAYLNQIVESPKPIHALAKVALLRKTSKPSESYVHQEIYRVLFQGIIPLDNDLVRIKAIEYLVKTLDE